MCFPSDASSNADISRVSSPVPETSHPSPTKLDDRCKNAVDEYMGKYNLY